MTDAKPSPRKCPTCRERAVGAAVLPTYETELEHDGRPYPIRVSHLRVSRCEKCGTILLDDDAGERLDDALRAAAGLLTPAEIREHRKRLGLTQEQLADLLRINVSTLSRWETGAQIQQRTLDAFLRVVFRFPEVRRSLGRESKDIATVVQVD
jgi:putative zinc finger/helix-turn-helix YgiT family protein